MKRIINKAIALMMMLSVATGAFSIPVLADEINEEQEGSLFSETDYSIAAEAYSDTGYYIATFDEVDVPADHDEFASAVEYTDDEAVIYERMIAMKSDYPEGKHWTNSDKYSWYNILYPEGSSMAYSQFIGGGCVAFAMILSDAAFGNAPAYERNTVVYDDLRVGDILRLKGDYHTVIILEKHDEGVVIAEGNMNSSVHWGRKLTKAEVEASEYYYTRYTETFTCTFETNGGSEIQPAKVVKSGLLKEPEAPVKDRYAFDGWFKDPELTKPWKFGSDKVNSDITLYARWKVDQSLMLKNVTLDKESVTLPLGYEEVISASAEPEDCRAGFSWTVDGDCIKISESGDKKSVTITPLAPGTATVTVTAFEKLDDVEVTKTDSAKVFVKRSGGKLVETIIVGEQTDISKAYFDGKTPASDFIFTPSVPGLVSIDKKGIMTVKKPGEVTVKVTDRYKGEEYDSVSFNVLPKPVIKFAVPLTYEGQQISVYDAITNVPEGAKYTFTGFASSKTDVAQIDGDGLITAGSAGKTNITVVISGKGKNGSVKDYSVKATLAVSKPQYAKTSYQVLTGQEMTISMKNVTAASGADYSSSDPERLAAQKQLNKKGAATGKAVIKGLAANKDNEPVSLIATIDGKQYLCDVYVKAPVISKAAVRVKEGKKTTVSLKNTKLKKTDVVWKSEDEKIARVESGGSVVGISKGTVTIYTETGGVRNECSLTVY
ncbi:MAG: Ig-like domain-containing protein [Lachnospiraceae bacterium]|nr:Ig-like domain-containing protein [Lachnospiraceae bacterium]